MKLSEVFRKAAELCAEGPWGWDEAIYRAGGNFSNQLSFEGLMFDCGEGFSFQTRAHRVLALCMAASIAESEGL